SCNRTDSLDRRGWFLQARLLGPLEISGPAGQAALGGQKQRAIIAHLLLRPGRLVPVDLLADAIWGDGPGDGVRDTMHVYVSRLRKALEVVEDGAGASIEFVAGGYRFKDGAGEVDSVAFVQLQAEGRSALREGDPARARDALERGLALWRGPALADFL